MLRYSVTSRQTAMMDSPLYYANLQYTDVMELDEFAKHIADHGSVYSRADIAAVLTMAIDCMKELALEGYRIKFGDLGTFFAKIEQDGAETYDDFSADNITKVFIGYRVGSDVDDLRDEAEFEKVITRAAAAAALAATASGVDVATTLSSADTSTSTSTDSTDDDDISDAD